MAVMFLQLPSEVKQRSKLISLQQSVWIIFLISAVARLNSETCSKTNFNHVKFGPSLPPEDIISNRSVHLQGECFMYCLLEATCVGFNYRPQVDENSKNCQLSNKAVKYRIENTSGEWSFYQDVKLVVVTTKAYCGHPGSPSYGYTIGTSYTYGSNVTFSCYGKDILHGPSSAVCQANGNWSNVPLRCGLFMRFEGTNDTKRGRLEIYRDYNLPYTVCDDYWSLDDARVVCREMGFRGASAFRRQSYYGKGNTGHRVMRNLPHCTGAEDSLRDCKRSAPNFWRTGCTSHTEDVGIDCY